MKTEKEEHNRQRAMSRENARAPPGTRRMGDDEKATMVSELEATKKELQMEIKIPNNNENDGDSKKKIRNGRLAFEG